MSMTTHLCTLLNGFFMRATLCRLLLGYINQVTTSLLYQFRRYPKVAISKVHPYGNLKTTLVVSTVRSNRNN
jgi:hypothetical protein